MFVLVVISRNSIARFAAVEIGSRVLNAQVEIDRIRVGIASVYVDGVRIYEPGSAHIQVEVSQIAIAPTPWQGIRHGVWPHTSRCQKTDALFAF